RIWQLLEELKLNAKIIEANSLAKRRYIVKNNHPVPLPDSVLSLLKTPLFSAAAKLRLLKEPFIAASDEEDESIASFIRRRLGKDPLNYAVNPFVSGVYAGTPDELSVKHTFSALWELEQQYGSLFKGLLKKERSKDKPKRALISFTEGNQLLPNALAGQLEHPVQTSTAIQSAKFQDQRWQLRANQSGRSIQASHDLVISTLPAYSLADIFGSEFRSLSSIPYAPVSSLALGYRKDQVQHPLDGFGMLIPAAEDYDTLGVLFSSTLFPSRAPEGCHLLSCFIGGSRNPQLASLPEKELKRKVQEELKKLLSINGQPVFTHHRLWQHAIPQYEVGYDRYLKVMDDLEDSHDGLLLEGNFRGGVSVPDCVSSAFETAEKACGILKRRQAQ